MIRRNILALVAFLSLAQAAFAVDAAPLAAEQMAKAIRSDTISIPSPGELFAALTKPGKPNWSTQYRSPIPSTFKNRAQIALNLGGLIADGFIAVQAQDSQQVKNTGGDIIKMARALGVSEKVLSRGNSISEFAEHNDWDVLQEELEATQNEVKSSMQSHSDQDLIILVSLGGWIRGTQVVSGVVAANFDARTAKVLRQPALVSYIRTKLNDMSPELRAEPLIKEISDQLANLEKLVAFPLGAAPTVEDVKKVNAAVSGLIQDIQSKGEAK